MMLAAFLLFAQTPSIQVTKIRFHPAPGSAMKGGRFTGSNESATNGFETLVEIREEPAPGGWTEVAVPNAPLYRYLKYEGTWNTGAAVGEVEFWSGDRKLSGSPFSTVPAEGRPASAAFDGDPRTAYTGKEVNGQYVGLDLGPESQAAPPTLSLQPGSYPNGVSVILASPTPGATVRYRLDGQTPDGGSEPVKGPVEVTQSGVLVARAFRDGLAPSIAVVAPYRIGVATATKTVRTFHIGNSLTDTVVPWMEPLAQAGGRTLEFHRFTIPGAPTDWLWDHPASGFGDSRYREAFAAYAPLDHLFTQPFAGHDRSVENEADYSRRFFAAAREHSPDLQPWLYVQWPTARLDDRWSQGEGAVRDLQGMHRPAQTYAEAVENHLRYAEAVRARINADWPGRPVAIVPAGLALARAKAEIEEGRFPGLTDLFKDLFSDDIHLNAKGAYLVSLVHYACVFGESPEGKLSPLNSGLTEEQANAFQKIAWDVVKGYEPARPKR